MSNSDQESDIPVVVKALAIVGFFFLLQKKDEWLRKRGRNQIGMKDDRYNPTR